MPERIRKIHVRLAMAENGWLLVARAMAQAKIKMTTVRMAVARFESMCSTPTLASTAVSPAKNAESKAHRNQFMKSPYVRQIVAESGLSRTGFSLSGFDFRWLT